MFKGKPCCDHPQEVSHHTEMSNCKIHTERCVRDHDRGCQCRQVIVTMKVSDDTRWITRFKDQALFDVLDHTDRCTPEMIS